jgi:predicted metalloprotease
MRWTPGGRSADVEDRRGRVAAGGFRGGPASIGVVLVLLVLSLLTGRNFLAFLDPGTVDTTDAPVSSEAPPVNASPDEERLVEFVSFVLDDAQKTWRQLLPGQYRNAKLVLFRDATQTGCGYGQAASGPFYCPADEKVYIDLGFYDELKERFGASGDFAQAYVITHEIGHHVQHLRGIDREVRQLQESRPAAANDLSMRLELQADCLAGVWGHSTAQRNILEQGDAEEALNAAASIGDDRIQRSSGRRVQPDSFTHGSSAQRVEWFRRGLDSGNLNACDTFGRGSD